MSNHSSRNWQNRLILEIQSHGSDLISAFVRLSRPAGDEPLSVIVEEINSATGMAYTDTDLEEWGKGLRPTPEPVQRYMRTQVAQSIFFGVVDDTRKAERLGGMLAQILEPPEERS